MREKTLSQLGFGALEPLQLRRYSVHPFRSFTSVTRVREIAGRWPQIEAVAAALLARGRLEALEIYRIIVKVR